jgi:hypothetical protein
MFMSGKLSWSQVRAEVKQNQAAGQLPDFVCGIASGEGGIRTHDGVTIPAFQASALDQLCDLSLFVRAAGLYHL